MAIRLPTDAIALPALNSVEDEKIETAKFPTENIFRKLINFLSQARNYGESFHLMEVGR